MKRILAISYVALMSLSVTGCDNWENTYGTPEKFLKAVGNSITGSSISVNDDFRSSSVRDYNLEIKTALSKAGPFTKIEQDKSSANKHFLYVKQYKNGLVGLTAAKYCIMSVYADGFIKIDYQDTKDDKYAYFTMNATKASEINDLVVTKIERDQLAKDEDKAKAYQEGIIENFFIEMDKKSSAKVRSIYTESNGNYLNKVFADRGELLTMMEEISYTRTSEPAPDVEYGLIYNVSSKGDNYWQWSFNLYANGTYVRIYYGTKNRFDESQTVYLNYKIDASEGKALIKKAYEMAKK